MTAVGSRTQMKVFKFGGASVKDASGVRNVANVLRHFPADDLVIVVSAMGKTTNALEEVVWTYREGRDVHPLVDRLRAAHVGVLAAVAPADAAALANLVHQFDRLEAALRRARSFAPTTCTAVRGLSGRGRLSTLQRRGRRSRNARDDC